MFELAVLADDRRLAEALGPAARDAERRDALAVSRSPSSSPIVDEIGKILLELSGKRIFDHRDGDRPPGRRRDRLAHLDMSLLDRT